MDGWIAQWVDGWMSSSVDGWMNEWMDEWKKGWLEGQLCVGSAPCPVVLVPHRQASPPSAPVSISDVETVREGHQSEVLQSLADEFPPERCFTIVFYGRRGNLDLIAGSAEEAQCWVQGLRQLIEVATSMDQREKIDQYPSCGYHSALHTQSFPVSGHPPGPASSALRQSVLSSSGSHHLYQGRESPQKKEKRPSDAPQLHFS